MHVHEIDARLLPKKVIVERRRIKSVVEQGRHDGVDLVFGEDEVSHHHVDASRAFRERHPTAKTECRRQLTTGNRHMQIVSRNADLEHGILEVASSA